MKNKKEAFEMPDMVIINTKGEDIITCSTGGGDHDGKHWPCDKWGNIIDEFGKTIDDVISGPDCSH